MENKRLSKPLYCLKHALRHDGGPTLFLFGVCLLLGSSLLTLGSEVGTVLILAGTAALALFLLLSTRRPCADRHMPTGQAIGK